VDHDDAGELARSFRSRRIGPHFSGGALVLDVSGIQPGVVRGDDLGFGGAAFQQRKQGGRGGRATGDLSQPGKEIPPVQSPLPVLLVEIEDPFPHHLPSS